MRPALRAASLSGLVLSLATLFAPSGSVHAQGPGTDSTPDPLGLDEVLASVEAAYPPLLAARIERDAADGRLRAARGIFDTEIFGTAGGTVDGYYEYTAYEAGVEQFLGLWGSTVYGGYRLTRGDELPDYYDYRTREDGELAFGLRIPILRGGPLDEDRAGLGRARLDRRAVEPVIARQRLDFVRAASVAYWRWVAAGRKRALAESLLALALDRTAALDQQVENGLRADIDRVDNRRLVVEREIGLLEARRDYQAAAVTLSLFLRDPAGEPVIPDEARLPGSLPLPEGDSLDVEADVARALRVRPELARRALDVAGKEIDLRLARNRLLPTLDAEVEASRDFGPSRYGDLARDELRAAVELKIPLPNRSASGARDAARATLEQARRELRFAADQVAAEVRTVAAEVEAARATTVRAELARDLAEELRMAEEARFQAGSSDLLALQIREQAAFEAERRVVDTRLGLLRALADYRAAVAEGVELDPDA